MKAKGLPWLPRGEPAGQRRLLSVNALIARRLKAGSIQRSLQMVFNLVFNVRVLRYLFRIDTLCNINSGICYHELYYTL